MEKKNSFFFRAVWPFFSYRLSFVSFFRRKNNSTGFSLIELLVVMGVIGVLATSLLILINPVGKLKGSRDGNRKSDLRQIQAALELYHSDNDAYPVPPPNSAKNCSSSLVDDCTDVTVTYLENVPSDPKTSLNYYYCTGTGPDCAAPVSGYSLYACLENTADSDPEVQNNGPAAFTCASNTYFKVTSP